VKFRTEHEFPGSVLGVAEILCDPDFHTRLDLPDLSRPEIVEHTVLAAQRTLRLRYEFVGHLDPIARRLLAGRRLTWIQELSLHTDTGVGQLSFAAEAEADRLYGQATVTLTALTEQRTRRAVAGDLFVKVPVVGGTAERRIVPGLVARLDVEAAALTAALITAT
jgi:hypothetical protein